MAVAAPARSQTVPPDIPPCGGYTVEIIQPEPCPFPLIDPPPTIGWGLSENGHIAGYHFQCDEGDQAFAWLGGPGLVYPPLPPGTYSSRAYDITDSGMVVGRVVITGVGVRGFVWQGHDFIVLHPEPPGQFCEAYAANDQGQVVGYRSLISSSPFNAFLWEDGAFTDLGVFLGPNSAATDINESLQITGWSGGTPPNTHAFLWEGGVFTDLGIIPGGTSSVGQGLNEAGDVVGYGRLIGPGIVRRAFLWSKGKMTDLDTMAGFIESIATGVNGHREVVGYCTDPRQFPAAFVWRDGSLTNLNSLIRDDRVVMISFARAINAAGQICADGVDTENNVIAMILTPVSTRDGDLDRDCHVDQADLSLLLSNWGPCIACSADLDGDGAVDGSDLGVLLLNWG